MGGIGTVHGIGESGGVRFEVRLRRRLGLLYTYEILRLLAMTLKNEGIASTLEPCLCLRDIKLSAPDGYWGRGKVRRLLRRMACFYPYELLGSSQ